MNLTRTGGLTLVALASMVFGPAASTAGTGPLSGAAALICDVNVPIFPSPVVTHGGTCDGIAAGVDFGFNHKGDYFVNFCDPACDFHADFNFFQVCPLDEPLSGFAVGVAHIENAIGVKPLRLLQDQSDPKATITDSDLWVPFSWIRVGATAVVFTGKLSASVNPGGITQKWWPDSNKKKEMEHADGSSKQADDLLGGVAAAAFVPDAPVPTCAAPATDYHATVVAAAVNIV